MWPFDPNKQQMYQQYANHTDQGTYGQIPQQEAQQDYQQFVKSALQIEEAKGGLRKAEQKMANARIENEVAAARLRTLEEELKKMQESAGDN